MPAFAGTTRDASPMLLPRIYSTRTPRTMPQCASVSDMFVTDRAAMPFMPCVFRLRRSVLPPPRTDIRQNVHIQYIISTLNSFCKVSAFSRDMQMWYPLGRKCVEIHIFSPLYYMGLITPLEHIVCFQLLLSGKSVVTMVRRILITE